MRWIFFQMIYLSFDDTDSRKGMCTTYLTLKIIQRVEEETGYLTVNYPLLVRLNPNIPWKTRGNGAVSIVVRPPLDHGEEFHRFFVGESFASKNRRTWYGYETEGEHNQHSHHECVMIKTMAEIVRDVISENSHLSDENTDPGLAVFTEKPAQDYYDKALHQLVERVDFEEKLKRDADGGAVGPGYIVDGFKKKRGIIGAVAATAWNWKEAPHTFELLAYRTEERLGTERSIRKEVALELDRRFPSSFNNYDETNDYCAIIPKSPCPVLYGIRGTDPEELYKASRFLDDAVEESIHSKIIFCTNQGTDAHIRKASVAGLSPYGSFRVRGRVSTAVVEIQGGHLFFEIVDERNTLKCAAFEPTKEFRNIIRELEVGDVVECWGGVHDSPFTLNMEKIRILELAHKPVKISNPSCDSCQRTMKSMGKDAGYRCPECGAKKGEDDAVFGVKKRNIEEGMYEVPVIARRHLAMPLKLRELFGNE